MKGASGLRASSSPSRRISCAWRSFLVVRRVTPAVRVVAQHQQLVAAAERHAGGHVEVPAHVAAGVVGFVLLLVNLQQDVAPRSRQGKVREGVGRLRLQPAAAEGQVLEGDLRVAECLAHLKLLTLGHCARVVAVRRLHMSQQVRRAGKREVLPRTALDFTHKIAAVAAPAHACRPTRHRSRSTQLASARARRSTRHRSRSSGSAVARARRPTCHRTSDTGAAVAHARRPTRRRSRSTQLASARARRATHRRSRGTGAAVARARRPTCRRTQDTEPASARARRSTTRRTRDTGAAVVRADTSSQAGAQVPLLNTLVFSHTSRRAATQTPTGVEFSR